MSDKVTFVPVNSSHRPLLRRWLASPHVREWWGDPEQELQLIAHGKELDGTEGFTIMLDQAPVGYIQSWVPSQFDNEGWEQRLSPDVRGIDVFIGETSALGNGAAIIRAFAHRLFAEGHHHLVIDPDKQNHRAIRAYVKAGFKKYDATEDSLLMELKWAG